MIRQCLDVSAAENTPGLRSAQLFPFKSGQLTRNFAPKIITVSTGETIDISGDSFGIMEALN